MARTHGEEAKDVARHFGENLIARRGSVGLSQVSTAERAGLHRTEIGLLEGGRRVPRLDTLLKVAGAVEVRPCELLDGIAVRLEPGKGGSS
jgi:transcriptional regulator with XRE-family HTH domain